MFMPQIPFSLNAEHSRIEFIKLNIFYNLIIGILFLPSCVPLLQTLQSARDIYNQIQYRLRPYKQLI